MNKNFFRWGSALAITGSLMALVSNAVHPRPHDITNFASHLTETAAHKAWAVDHLFITLSFMLMMWGWVAIARSYGINNNIWAALAIPTAAVATAVSIIFLSIDGYALKLAADIWQAASGPEKDLAFSMAQGMDILDRATFFIWIMTAYGFTPIIYGLATIKNTLYPRWMGWIAILLGAVDLVISSVMFVQGPTNNTVSASVGVFFMFALWTLIMGVLLWRRSELATQKI
jgi:hypothetical protein